MRSTRCINEIGNRHGWLTVFERAPNLKSGNGYQACWVCECDCGRIIVAAGGELRRGNVKSCGCYRDTVTLPQNRAKRKIYRK